MSVVSKNVEDVYTSKDIPCIKELEEAFETSLLDLLHDKFIPEFVDIDYPVVKIKNHHRRKLVHVNNIGLIKQLIRKRLGRIAPKVFFVKFGIKDYPIDNFNIDKALVILFFMVCGCSQREIGKGKHNLIDATGFGKILKQFLTDELDQWCDRVLAECFSNATTRLLYAYIHNPEMEQTCTMSFDGHDQRINYRAALKNPKVKFYSYKHKKCAYRTQVCCDIFDFVLGISSSKGCAMKNSADISMMKAFDFKPFLANTDCCYMDGAYKFGIQEIVDKLNTITNQEEDDEEIIINRSDELLSDDEIDLDDENEFKKKHLDCNSDTESTIDYSTDSEDSDNSKTDQPFIPANFLTPIRKTRGKKFKGSEKFYNKSFGGKRSHIESKFARHGKMFKQFSHCSAMSLEPNTYNRLLKLSHVLHNIKQMEILFAEYLDIPIDNDQWMSEMFDYPTKKQLKRKTISTKEELEKRKQIASIQISKLIQITSEIRINNKELNHEDYTYEHEENEHEENEHELKRAPELEQSDNEEFEMSTKSKTLSQPNEETDLEICELISKQDPSKIAYEGAFLYDDHGMCRFTHIRITKQISETVHKVGEQVYWESDIVRKKLNDNTHTKEPNNVGTPKSIKKSITIQQQQRKKEEETKKARKTKTTNSKKRENSLTPDQRMSKSAKLQEGDDYGRVNGRSTRIQKVGSYKNYK